MSVITNYWSDWFAPKMLYFIFYGIVSTIFGLFFGVPIIKILQETMPNVFGWNLMIALPFTMFHFLSAAVLLGEFFRKNKKRKK